MVLIELNIILLNFNIFSIDAPYFSLCIASVVARGFQVTTTSWKGLRSL